MSDLEFSVWHIANVKSIFPITYYDSFECLRKASSSWPETRYLGKKDNLDFNLPLSARSHSTPQPGNAGVRWMSVADRVIHHPASWEAAKAQANRWVGNHCSAPLCELLQVTKPLCAWVFSSVKWATGRLQWTRLFNVFQWCHGIAQFVRC